MKRIIFCYFVPKNQAYTPLDIGYIKAIIESQFPQKYIIEIARFDHSPLNEKRIAYYGSFLLLRKPDAIFFFLDNVLLSRVYALGAAEKIAKYLRQKNSNIFIGVQSYKTHKHEREKTLKEKTFDAVIKTDPEYSFQFLQNILQKKEVPGVSTLDRSDNFSDLSEAEIECKKNLENIPSPYLSTAFDTLLEKKSKKTTGPFEIFLQTSRGCPFGCYYCFRSVKYENMSYFPVTRVYDEIEYIVNNFSQFSFSIIDDCFITSKQRLQEFVDEFEKRKKYNPKLENINIFANSRPEFLNQETIELLKKIHITRLQMGIQTINPSIQKYMTREIDIQRFQEISLILKKIGIPFQVDVIIGLPNDTIEYFKKTLDFAVSLEPYQLQVKQLYHQPNTRFDQEYDIFALETEKEIQDFCVPYVKKAKNINAQYQREAFDYLISRKNQHPEIEWVYLSESGNSYVEK